MKFRVFVVLMLAALFLTACRAGAVEDGMDAVGDAVENGVNSVGDAVENGANSVGDAIGNTANNTASPAVTQSTAQGETAKITQAEAEAIALEHAGLTADQVRYLHTEYEIDNGVPQYEVEFHQDRWEYDYEINAETGAVISFDKND